MLLLVVENKSGYQIGALQRRIKMTNQKVEDTAIRDATQFNIDFFDLFEAIKQCDHVTRVLVRQNTRFGSTEGTQKVYDLMKETGINAEKLEF